MAKTPAPEAAATARPAYRGPANLAGKIAIVTGGTQGLGEAIARLFAERGAAGLVICGRNAERGERVAKRHLGGRLPDRLRPGRSRQSRRLPQGRRRGGQALRARRRAGQRRRR